jgi:hypothetical protein
LSICGKLTLGFSPYFLFATSFKKTVGAKEE